MATNVGGRPLPDVVCGAAAAVPAAFRERFSEGMAQTFRDLCQERKVARRGLFGFALWIFCDTLVGIVKENTTHVPQLGKTMLRVALGAMAVLMVPLVASQFVKGWNWPVGAFMRVYVLLFGTGMVFALVARRMGAWSYKAGVAWPWSPGSPCGGRPWSKQRTQDIRSACGISACS
jgi:hypothetical protein